jgi:predicted transcriptional regulator
LTDNFGGELSTPIFTEVITMHSETILTHLKRHGQLLDSEIATATGIPLSAIQTSLAELSAQGEISKCSVTRYNDGKAVKGMLCRIAGFIPRPSPGRKPGVKN